MKRIITILKKNKSTEFGNKAKWLLLFVFFFGFQGVWSQTNYYYNGVGNINATASWGTNTNGTGTAPTNFTTASRIFNIRNSATPSLNGAWTVSGASSKIVIGDGSSACNFTVGSNFVLTAPVDVSAGATITLSTTGSITGITFGTLNATSTVDFASTSAQIIPTVAYGNLTVSGAKGANNVTFAGATNITGNLTVSATGNSGVQLVFNDSATVRTFNIGGDYIQTGYEAEMGAGSATTTINFSGNFSKTGGYIVNTTAATNATFNYSGTTQNIQCNGGTDARWINFNVLNGSVCTLNGQFNYNGISPPGTFTVNSGGVLNCGTFNVLTASSTTAIFNVASGGTLGVGSIDGISTSGATGNIQSAVRTYSTGANYIYNGTSAQVTGNGLTANTPANLTITNTAGVTLSAAPTLSGTLAVTSGTLDSAAFQIIGNATNNFTLASGTTFRTSGGTTANFPTLFTGSHCIFNSTSIFEYYGTTQTVSSTPTYGNLVITTAGTKTPAAGLTIAGGLTINSGATFAGSTFTHAIAGDWTNSGTFTAGTSTINLNGTAQNITGAATTFNNLTLSTSSSTKTFGVATIIGANLTINTGVVANLGSGFKHTAATLTLGGSAQTTGTSYGGTGSPAAVINTTYFANNTGYLNIGVCSTYSLTSIAAAAAICLGNPATINVTSTVGNLPNGAYTLAYTLGSPNAGTGSTSMTVSGGAGTGSFATSTLANNGSTNITISSLTKGCVSTLSSGNSATITVNLNTAGAASSTPTLCINTALTAITSTTTGATGIGSPTGLPTGVTAAWASNTITISGTPTASGTFNYSIPLIGGCGSVNATGTITVTLNNTAGTASSSPIVCINTALTNITHITTGATGIGTVTGLPTGVTAAWSSNTITISGTPTASGTFNYTIPLTGGCGSVNATGTITVTPNNTAGTASSSPIVCINTALTNITHVTTGATGIGTATGLPAGVTAVWASNTITISGTPSASGTFNYTIPLTGGCGSVTATGTITVNPLPVAAGTITGTTTVCQGQSGVVYSVPSITNATSYTWSYSGTGFTPSASTASITGTFSATATSGNLTVRGVNACGNGTVSATFAIIVNVTNTAGTASSTPTLCINTALTSITHSTTGATGIGTATGLPAGVTAAWASNTITISGTPTASGTFNYTIPLTGGCSSVNATGTITVRAASTAAVISGTTSICSGSTTNLSVAITGGTSPYTVAYTTGSVSSYTSGSNIPVSPTSTTTYSITSVTDANGCVGSGNSGSAVITLTSTSTSDGITWSNGSPTGTKDAIFTGNATIGADLAACSLIVTNNAVVSIASGFDVTLNGALTVSSGSFTVNNNANLLQNNSNYSNSGNVIVKRNTAGLMRFDYVLWSSPVSGQQLLAFSPLTNTSRFYTFNGALGTAGQYSVVSSPSTTNFTTANGYLIRMPFNHPTAPTVWNGTFTGGTPNNGTISLTGLTSGQYYATGNPYPSTIDANTFISDNSITQPLYFWRKTNNVLQATNPSVSYATYTTAGGTKSGGDTLNIVPNGTIQVGEGFIVKLPSSSISFNNAERTGNNLNQFLRTTAIERNRIWLNLSNSVLSINQMMIAYMTGATNGVDAGIDGLYINDSPTALNSFLNNQEYAIQGRSLPFDPSDVVPLTFKTVNAGNYTITLDNEDGLFTGGAQLVYLKDNLTGTYQNLNAGAYTFSTLVGTFNDRFEIVYALPLGIHNPTFTANTVIIYPQNNEFVVNSGSIMMSTIKVFDIRGRLLEEKTAVNASQTTISGGLANEVLLVQITSEDGVVVTKKVVR